jgi:hypothetical protein
LKKGLAVFNFHVYTHADEEILKLLRAIHAQGQAMALTLDDLKAKVQRNTTVAQSALTLIQGISQRLKDAAGDPAKIQALADELDATDIALADAVSANTPAEPSVPPAPVTP